MVTIHTKNEGSMMLRLGCRWGWLMGWVSFSNLRTSVEKPDSQIHPVLLIDLSKEIQPPQERWKRFMNTLRKNKESTS